MLVGLNGRGEISWDGAPIDERALIERLETAREFLPPPFLILEPDQDADCASVKRLRRLMDERFCNQRWACGEGKGEWEQVMPMPDPNSEETRRLEDEADQLAEAAAERRE